MVKTEEMDVTALRDRGLCGFSGAAGRDGEKGEQGEPGRDGKDGQARSKEVSVAVLKGTEAAEIEAYAARAKILKAQCEFEPIVQPFLNGGTIGPR